MNLSKIEGPPNSRASSGISRISQAQLRVELTDLMEASGHTPNKERLRNYSAE